MIILSNASLKLEIHIVKIILKEQKIYRVYKRIKMYCSGVTNKNTPCLNKCKGKENYCYIHKKKKYNECMICYEHCTKEYKMKCGHSMCMTCTHRCTDIRCPMCRALTNESGEINYKLRRNLSELIELGMSKNGDERVNVFHKIFQFVIENHQLFLNYETFRESVKDRLFEFRTKKFDADKYLKQIEAYETKLTT